ncbi:hypothetical protein B0H19DRAFT_533411 [Mycena capillaripes]|nr:hypothetical protein B0H19DRAFT_533411 [Mycena capillaripes]
MASNPVFPVELEREIFGITALVHPSAAPTLLRVARRVLIWIEPLLYRVVRLSSGRGDMKDVILKAAESKPPEFFRKSVRHLCVEFPTSVDEAVQILKLCSGVVDVGFNRGSSHPQFLPILADMKLQRFAGCLLAFFGQGNPTDLRHPLFALITHLDVFDSVGDGLNEICAQIPTLPALTHLALYKNVPDGAVEALTRDCPLLKLLFVLWPTDDPDVYEAGRVPRIYDVRYVMALYTDTWEDWQASARGLAHLWSRGEDFIARKRRGEIEATRYWLE